jgi:hypothetical protein
MCTCRLQGQSEGVNISIVDLVADNGFSYSEDEECMEFGYKSHKGGGFFDVGKYSSCAGEEGEHQKLQTCNYNKLKLAQYLGGCTSL